MPATLIVGASRGIGLEFVRQYRAENWTVHATHRTEPDRLALLELGAHTLQLDVCDPSELAGAAWQLDGEQFDVVVLNAGTYGPRTSNLREPPTDEQFDQVLHTNVLAPMRLLPVVAPLLTPTRGTLAFMSSRMGSIEMARASYGMLYRVSKAAANMVARLAHAELSAQRVRVLALHPGWVRTDMGGPNAEVELHESVAGLRRVIADPEAWPGGSFVDYRGQPIPW